MPDTSVPMDIDQSQPRPKMAPVITVANMATSHAPAQSLGSRGFSQPLQLKQTSKASWPRLWQQQWLFEGASLSPSCSHWPIKCLPADDGSTVANKRLDTA